MQYHLIMLKHRTIKPRTCAGQIGIAVVDVLRLCAMLALGLVIALIAVGAIRHANSIREERRHRHRR